MVHTQKERRAVADFLEKPIDLKRDGALLEVPAEVSTNADVNARWTAITVAMFDGAPVEYLIKDVEEAIIERKRLIDEGLLDPRYDWKYDLERARSSYRYHVTHLEYVKNKRTSYIGFWTSWITESNQFNQQISLNGLKAIFLFHGAIALGALNILARSDAPATQLALTAKCAIAFSVLGIIIAGFGQLTIFYFGTAMVARVRGKLVGDVKWSKVRAVGRYFRRYNSLPLLGNKAVYASMFWFAVYVLILLIMLLSV
jgi:hypothetical protein